MKKNGFTLIEMLVVLTIIGSLSAVVGVSVVSMLKSQQQKMIEKNKETIENAACAYVELNEFNDICKKNRSCTVTVNKLINLGLLSDELEDSGKVTIKWDRNGLKTCTYNP